MKYLQKIKGWGRPPLLLLMINKLSRLLLIPLVTFMFLTS